MRDPKSATHFEYLTIEYNSPKFSPDKDFFYHGTSLEALDMILRDRRMIPADELLESGKLVWGEMLRVDARAGNMGKGPKFISPEVLIQRGYIQEGDERLKNFGHAYKIAFSRDPKHTLSYTPEDRSQRAVIGINSKVLKTRGFEFIDCQGEGIMHSGVLPIDFGLQQLLVPRERIEEYERMVNSNYMVQVFPVEELD